MYGKVSPLDSASINNGDNNTLKSTVSYRRRLQCNQLYCKKEETPTNIDLRNNGTTQRKDSRAFITTQLRGVKKNNSFGSMFREHSIIMQPHLN